MSETMAAPEPWTPSTPGKRVLMQSEMTMRDYFAGQAVTGLLAGLLADGSKIGDKGVADIAATSFQLADALLAARTLTPASETMAALAARVEALDGKHEGLHPICDEIHALQPEPKVVVPLDYVRSLDAAMTLVPEGWSWETSSEGRASVIRHTEDSIYWEDVNAATPALALTAAALRARAAMEDTQ